MSRAPWLTRAEVNAIHTLLSQGLSHRAIAASMARSTGTVARVRARLLTGTTRPLTRRMAGYAPNDAIAALLKHRG